MWLGLSDSVWSLILTYPTFLVPFSTWLLMGYFRTIPQEVEECALVDGATRMQTLCEIVLPMAVPGLVCAALFGFTLCWNEFIYALTFVSQTANKTAVVGVTADLIRGDIYYWGSLMAGAILASVPIVIVLRPLPRLLRLRPHRRRREGLTRRAPIKAPTASSGPSAGRSTYREYASRPTFGPPSQLDLSRRPPSHVVRARASRRWLCRPRRWWRGRRGRR